MDYAVAVYGLAASFPVEEKYNLASQLRRAATSVPLNIAEGCGSASNTEFGRFLSYAYRSLKEAVSALELCQRLYPSLRQDRIAALIDEGRSPGDFRLESFARRHSCLKASARPACGDLRVYIRPLLRQ